MTESANAGIKYRVCAGDLELSKESNMAVCDQQS